MVSVLISFAKVDEVKILMIENVTNKAANLFIKIIVL